MATMLALIGRRDPISDGEETGPLRTVMAVDGMTRAYLFATPAPPIQAAAEATMRYLSALGIDVRKMDIDPDVLSVSVEQLQQWFERTLRDLEIEGDLHVMATSGTPQAMLALTTGGDLLVPGRSALAGAGSVFQDRAIPAPF